MCIFFNIYHGYHVATWAQANNSDRNLDMHYIELYTFALDLYSNSLNHFTWKRLKVTVLPLSRYAHTWLDHDDVSIGLYCALLALQRKANLRSTSVKVMNTLPLGYSMTRLENQNRKFAPILIITGPKMIISLYANKLGLSIRGSEILQKWLWLESRVIIVTRVKSSHSVKNVTRVESSHHLSQRDLSRVRVIIKRDSSRVIDSIHVSQLICSYESTDILLVDFDLFNRHNQWYFRGQHYTALLFPLLLMFIENGLVNNCLIMITAKANVFLSLLKFIDANW